MVFYFSFAARGFTKDHYGYLKLLLISKGRFIIKNDIPIIQRPLLPSQCDFAQLDQN